jgi:tetratricopeptide (TPR) repeat protein
LGARPEAGEGMASGDVVNTAARLQSAAPVDGILVGEQTYRATKRVIEYRESEPIVAKGKAEPVRVWEAVQARAHFGVDLARPSSPLVGRERELDVMLDAFARACQERTVQLVTIVGVPGIGKSRLLAEGFAAIDRSEQLVVWRQGRSLPYGEGVSFWALGEMVKAQAGILETDEPDVAGRKLDEAVGALVQDETEERWISSHLRPLAGLSGEDDAKVDRRGEAFAAWRRFFELLAGERPLVLVFEDLHWADDGLLDFVDQLADRLTTVPLFLVASARPELYARRPTWAGGKANATTLSLAPLSDEETASLVHTLLERSELPGETQATLLERAGGNPLYAEEFVRMADERGLANLELPESVQGIIAARLDALQATDKELLQDAAVIGKVFWSGALGQNRFELEERLHELERREFVRREPRSSVDGQTEYAFRHVLVRDVAYGTIPRAARAEKHCRAAQWFETLGRPDDHADLLAHHYLSALELARAAGTNAGVLAAAAATALERAGDRDFALNAFENAIRFYDEALALGIDEGQRPRVLFRLGAALLRSGGARRNEVLEEARDALLAAGDPEEAAEASALLAEAYWSMGEGGPHREALERAQKLVRDRGRSPAAARVLAQTARYAAVAGDRNDEAIRVGRDALGMAENLGLDELISSALNSIGTARARLGDRAGGIADLERAIDVALAANNPEAARAYNNLAIVVWNDGDLGRAIELALEAKAVGDRLGNTVVSRHVEGTLMWMRYGGGEWEEVLRAANALIAASESGSPRYHEYLARMLRARILHARGDDSEVKPQLVHALEHARSAGDPQAILPVLVTMSWIYGELGDQIEARRAANEILEAYRGRADISTSLFALAAGALDMQAETRAALAEQPGNDTAHVILDGDLGRAADLAEAEGDIAFAAHLRLRAGDPENVAAALAFFRSVGATRYIREAEELLASAPELQHSRVDEVSPR